MTAQLSSFCSFWAGNLPLCLSDLLYLPHVHAVDLYVLRPLHLPPTDFPLHIQGDPVTSSKYPDLGTFCLCSHQQGWIPIKSFLSVYLCTFINFDWHETAGCAVTSQDQVTVIEVPKYLSLLSLCLRSAAGWKHQMKSFQTASDLAYRSFMGSR